MHWYKLVPRTVVVASTSTLWGQRIIDGRRTIGLTQVQLAAALKVSQQLVSCWERGVCCPRIDRRPIIARILGIPTDELFAYPTNGDEEAA